MSLASAPAGDVDFLPIPGSRAQGATPERRRRRKRRRWYRRKRVLIPLVITLLFVLALGAAAFYINQTFQTLNSLSTPPPEISGAQLGGDERLTIDTGPAQEALREAESRREGGEVAPGGIHLPDDQGASAGATPGAGGGVDATPGADGVSVAGGTPPAERVEADPEIITVLLMGVDARPGEAIDIGVRPDSLAVATLNPETGACRLLSIPRDSRVELPGYGPSKINHALAVAGVPYEILVVENLVGFRIEHYGLIDFSGVEDLVDAVGGVTVVNDMAFSAGGFDFPEGELRLNGAEALAYSRYRGGPDGDFGRQERQQQIMRGLLSEGADLDMARAVPSLLNSVEGHVRTDLGPQTMTDLAVEFQGSCTASTLETSRIHGDVATLYDALFQQDLSFVVLDEREVAEKVAWVMWEDEESAGSGEAGQ